MIKRYTDGLLFLKAENCVLSLMALAGHTPKSMRKRFGLLPIKFYITFDGFLTVAKSRLVWRWQHDISVVFERWLDIRQGTAIEDQADVSRAKF